MYVTAVQSALKQQDRGVVGRLRSMGNVEWSFTANSLTLLVMISGFNQACVQVKKLRDCNPPKSPYNNYELVGSSAFSLRNSTSLSRLCNVAPM